ncbi:MAG: cyclic nucleotide-binding domain-containing protein [Acidimicrobiia bacterium]|nr:cyclic nucleotide-binding domain-containing protein [Acidimicrobiia bacterium]
MNLSVDLGTTELLSHLTDEEIEFLESVATEFEYAQGDVLFEEDSEATRFHIIISGKVGLELVSPRRRPIVIQTLGPGELVGLSWFFPPHTWNWRASALNPTKTLGFDAAAVRNKCAEDRNLAEQILRLVAREAVARLHATRTQLLDLYEFPR